MEARIAVKVVANRFVSVWPSPPPKPDEQTFPQRLLSTRQERVHRLRQTPPEPMGIGEYVRTREDQTA
jgi:hypothetical protein